MNYYDIKRESFLSPALKRMSTNFHGRSAPFLHFVRLKDRNKAGSMRFRWVRYVSDMFDHVVMMNFCFKCLGKEELMNQKSFTKQNTIRNCSRKCKRMRRSEKFCFTIRNYVAQENKKNEKLWKRQRMNKRAFFQERKRRK